MAVPFGQDIRSDTGKREARSRIAVLAFIIGAFCSGSPAAEPERPRVDLELVLAVDVSSSMSLSEQRVQRDGYVSAFRHPELTRSILSGRRGMIAVSYLEWAGPSYQRIVRPWTIVGSYDEARRFADSLAIEPLMAQPGTSISGALLSAADLFAQSRTATARRVIDVSGDGPNNVGPPVAPIRDRLTSSGITINGLPVSMPRHGSNGFQSFGEHYLNLYYEHCVIGGPDAFVIGIDDLAQFERAIRRKLVLEIAGMPPRPRLASYRLAAGSAFDCSMIGTSAR